MKKAKKRRQLPSAASLRELPELDVAAYRARPNPYAARLAREGIELVHEDPSPESLADLPELDFATLRARPNPYASRAVEAVARMQYGRGRPARDREVGPTTTRTIRLPSSVWRVLDVEARQQKTTVHALLRNAIATYLERHVFKADLQALDAYTAKHGSFAELVREHYDNEATSPDTAPRTPRPAPGRRRRRATRAR